MLWQDLVLFLGSIFFGIALVPALLSEEKPPAFTCFMTVFWLLAIAVAEYSLELYMTVFVTIINASLWALLGIQKLLQ